MDYTEELHVAIYDRLAADAALTALIGAGHVYDDPPDSATLPYVVIGDGTALDAGAVAIDAQEHTVTLHCWSEAASTLELRRMIAAVRAALHDADLVLAAGRCPNIRCEFVETLRDPDGVSHHGVMRFRAITQD